MDSISVVIPIYGCRAAIPELYQRLTDTLNKITSDYEIIMVNDACPQNSWEVIDKICRKDSHVKGIEFSRNFGQMKAILAGLDYSCGDWVVVMDCDLQDRPEDIEKLYIKAKEGYDCVFARRDNRNDSASRSLLAKIFYKLYSYATDGNYDPNLCNFSICKRKVIDAYCSMREEHRGYVMYIKWLGFKQTAVELQHDKRFEGESSYTFKKRMKQAFELLTSQSDKILKFAVKAGFALTFLSVIGIIILVIQYFVAHISPGWTSLIAVNCLIGGIIIMVVGIVGLYVGNIFVQTKHRPLYVVRQALNEEKK